LLENISPYENSTNEFKHGCKVFCTYTLTGINRQSEYFSRKPFSFLEPHPKSFEAKLGTKRDNFNATTITQTVNIRFIRHRNYLPAFMAA